MLLSPSEFICLPVSYIRIFDAEAAQQLEPWVRVGKDAHLPKGHHSSNTPEDTALLNMLYDLDIDPAFIDDDRTAAAHDAYSVLIFCKVLFGLTTAELWGHPDFEAFKIGYNIQVEYGNTHSRRFLLFFPPERIKSLIAGLYIPPIVDASALIPRLCFEISGAERRVARSRTRHDFAQLFGRAILRYLKGLGHPEHEVITEFQTLTQGDIASESGSSHTRANLLLAAFTESKLLPREDIDWNLKFIMEDPGLPDTEASTL
ncbi:hypothetical protein FIBSPDRAFT_965558 [Athelia psychrophila]|uniref:Uncharacterized protein n=1 Tax=Athelia psychrophila TaxID=1759441 RepID=A0A165WBV0_9AGAM|nr:hypothetical protein FIBSPDRAFT_965558 [Fibularhizoctonia sp. CBS 109695]